MNERIELVKLAALISELSLSFDMLRANIEGSVSYNMPMLDTVNRQISQLSDMVLPYGLDGIKEYYGED